MNTSEIQIVKTRMTGKDFNRFLKHWIAGSNPRLKYLSVGGQSKTDDGEQFAMELLHGINYRKMADGEKMTCVICMGTSEERMETVSGGSYIRRKDGTKAIVYSEDIWFQLILQEFVNI
ncbi:hypothetical protein CRE_26625 [Caenorhabditis remanei]|uniref:Sdz-33 F-box domain-containing protein n=1 Tax=Caenorhabditis remanei TaxID=31234 RepID=E3MKX7_CAERE|nr:hypothetical protein CRE_26625 [Caenorhabditis remanei]